MKRIPILFVLLTTIIISAYAQYHSNATIKNLSSEDFQFYFTYENDYQVKIQDGKPALVIYGSKDSEQVVCYTLKDFMSIDFHTIEEDITQTRNALTEFYEALNGGHWVMNNNWCTDKPFAEWDQLEASVFPRTLWLNMNQLSGQLPACLNQVTGLHSFYAFGNNLTGTIPASWGNNLNLSVLMLEGNQLTGDIPLSLADLPNLWSITLDNNNFSGPLPEQYIIKMMDRADVFTLNGNDFSGKVPESIQKHPRFKDFWNAIIAQRGNLDLSDITIPAFSFECTDIKGNKFTLDDVYKSHKYTLLYSWGFTDPFSLEYNEKLVPAYNAYKDKGFEVVAFNGYDDAGMKQYVEENHITWLNIPIYDMDKIPGWWWKYHKSPLRTAIPGAHLVDKDGNIVFSTCIDKSGNDMDGNIDHRNKLFAILEEEFGKVDDEIYTSTDYSKDGEVMTLQSATVGQGVDIVFLGNGFVDKDMGEDGKYEKRMKEAMEQFFAYEPFTSLRNRFNVYAVKVVSANSESTGNHAINNNEEAFEYAKKVTSLKAESPLRVNVVYNNIKAGRSITYMYDDASYIAYMYESGQTLNHEAGGHGVGRLYDEYVEIGYEEVSLSEEGKLQADQLWTNLGRGANIDWRSDPTEVKWAKFITDERYASEGIGVYEGSWLVGYGAYRPTFNSMMRHNDIPFNAPSREAIYKYVMQESEGDSWTYDYEAFVAFDEAGRAEFVNALNSSARQQAPRRGMKQQEQHLTAPPVFVKGTWRDVLNKKKYHNKK